MNGERVRYARKAIVETKQMKARGHVAVTAGLRTGEHRQKGIAEDASFDSSGEVVSPHMTSLRPLRTQQSTGVL